MSSLRSWCSLAAFALLVASSAQADYSQHPRAGDLLTLLKREYKFSSRDLARARDLLEQAEQIPELVEKEKTAKEKTLNWSQYRPLHLTDANVRNGAALLAAQEPWLSEVEARFGVAPAVVLAILGVETKYGTYTGGNRILDALATQGFEHPTRFEFFFRELAEFMVFCREFDMPCEELRGSYAGAMGAAQFMPSNYRLHALDFNRDKRVDLWGLPDAIGSIGNYLTRYNPNLVWRRGQPLIVPLDTRNARLDGFERNLKVATYTVEMLQQRGARPAQRLPPDLPVGLIELAVDGGVEHWLALHNFYVVMTYNPRIFYGMAVAQLALEIERAAGVSAP